MVLITASDLDRRITIQRPMASADVDGAGSGTWSDVATNVPAQVRDVLPSRGERLADGATVGTRPARVRMRFRSDVTASMRFVMGERVMHIVSGPAEIGRREGLEFLVEEYQPAGNSA